MSEVNGTYQESREPATVPQKRSVYDWRLQQNAEDAVDFLARKMKARHIEGISTYGPYFQGDPFVNAHEENIDEWHYIEAGRRQRDAYLLALKHIASIMKCGYSDKDTLDEIRRVLDQVQEHDYVPEEYVSYG